MSFPNLAQALEETFNTSLCINMYGKAQGLDIS